MVYQKFGPNTTEKTSYFKKKKEKKRQAKSSKEVLVENKHHCHLFFTKIYLLTAPKPGNSFTKPISAWMPKKTVSGRSSSVFNTTRSTLRLKIQHEIQCTGEADICRADILEIF